MEIQERNYNNHIKNMQNIKNKINCENIKNKISMVTKHSMEGTEKSENIEISESLNNKEEKNDLEIRDNTENVEMLGKKEKKEIENMEKMENIENLREIRNLDNGKIDIEECEDIKVTVSNTCFFSNIFNHLFLFCSRNITSNTLIEKFIISITNMSHFHLFYFIFALNQSFSHLKWFFNLKVEMEDSEVENTESFIKKGNYNNYYYWDFFRFK